MTQQTAQPPGIEGGTATATVVTADVKEKYAPVATLFCAVQVSSIRTMQVTSLICRS